MLITIITEDQFGSAIALYLQRKFAVEQISLKQALQRDWHKKEAHGLVAICMDRPYFSAFEDLATKLQKANLPFTFACIRDSNLLIGPLVVAGKSACYRCFQRRMLCHMGSAMKIERVVRTALDRDWSLKSPGMLPTTPALAASRLATHALLRERDYGRVTFASLVGSRVEDFQIQRVHGCDCLPSVRTDGSEPTNSLVEIVEKLFS